MVQILPGVPTFSDKLTQVLSQAGVNIGEGFQKRSANQQDQRILSDIGSGNLSPLQIVQSAAGLSPQASQAISPLLSQFLKPQKLSPYETQRQKHQADKEKKEEERKEDLAGLNNSLKFLENNLEYTGYNSKAFLGMIPGTKASAIQEDFNKTGFLVADKIFTLFNKGALYKEKFKYIIKDLSPNANLPEYVNKGRIDSLNRIANLDPNISEKDFESALKKEREGLEKESKNPSREVNVYDSNGTFVGTIEQSQVNELPKGYTVR